jgi:hypothetical protein
MLFEATTFVAAALIHFDVLVHGFERTRRAFEVYSHGLESHGAGPIELFHPNVW